MELGDSLIPLAIYPFLALTTMVIVFIVCERRRLTRHIPFAVGWTLVASTFVVAAAALPHEYLSPIFWLALVLACVMNAITLWRLTVHAARRYLALRLARQ